MSRPQQRVAYTCPYCGFTQVAIVDQDRPTIVHCNSDEGGCDLPAVVTAVVTVTATVEALESSRAKWNLWEAEHERELTAREAALTKEAP